MSTPYVATEFTAPSEQPDNARFWQAAREGQLLLKVCDDCGKPHWYPRTLCPFCLGSTHWQPAAGHGTIYTYSIMRRGTKHPYCIAYVTLDEGVTMMTNIVDCDLDAVHIGQEVQVKFSSTQDAGAPVPTFAPV